MSTTNSTKSFIRTDYLSVKPMFQSSVALQKAPATNNLH
jgi:hypothetical protein